MTKKGTKRSPRYPAIGLEEAVKKVGKLYEADRTAGAPAEAAMKHMGYSGRTGPANTAIAALRRFGLVESKAGRVVPSQLAIAILLLPEDDHRRIAALQETALSPETYAELFEEFRPAGGIPSAESMEHDLIIKGEFNPNAVKTFVKDFRESLIFAGLIDENGVILSVEESVNQGDEEAGDSSMAAGSAQMPPPATKLRASPVTPGQGVKQDVFTLDEGDVVVQRPAKLSAESLEDLSAWWEIMLRKIQRSVSGDDSEK